MGPLGAKDVLSGGTPHSSDLWPPLRRETPKKIKEHRKTLQQETTSIIPLKNRFAPLSSSPSSPQRLSAAERGHRNVNKDKTSRTKWAKRTENSKRGRALAIIHDGSIKGIEQLCINTSVFNCPQMTVKEISERIPSIIENNPELEKVVVHAGAADILLKKSEILKKDFLDLLQNFDNHKVQLHVSGPIPATPYDEEYSRMKSFSRFVKTVCAERSIRYLNNFKIFCGRKHLFTRNERNINKKGQRLYLLNLLSHVNSSPCSQIEIKTSVSAETHSGRQPAVSHRDHDVLAPFSDKPARDVSANPKTTAPDDSKETQSFSNAVQKHISWHSSNS